MVILSFPKKVNLICHIHMAPIWYPRNPTIKTAPHLLTPMTYTFLLARYNHDFILLYHGSIIANLHRESQLILGYTIHRTITNSQPRKQDISTSTKWLYLPLSPLSINSLSTSRVFILEATTLEKYNHNRTPPFRHASDLT